MHASWYIFLYIHEWIFLLLFSLAPAHPCSAPDISCFKFFASVVACKFACHRDEWEAEIEKQLFLIMPVICNAVAKHAHAPIFSSVLPILKNRQNDSASKQTLQNQRLSCFFKIINSNQNLSRKLCSRSVFSVVGHKLLHAKRWTNFGPLMMILWKSGANDADNYRVGKRKILKMTHPIWIHKIHDDAAEQFVRRFCYNIRRKNKKILTCGPRDNLQDRLQSWPSRKKHGMCAQLVQPN